MKDAQEDVEHFQTTLDSAEAAPVGSARADKIPKAKEELAAAKVALGKVKDKVPTAARSQTALVKAIGCHNDATEKRTDAWKVGEAKAASCLQEAGDAIDTHIAEWLKYKEDLQKEYDTRKALWDTHHGKITEVTGAVSTTLQERLEAAKKAGGQAEPVTVAPATPPPTPTPTPPDESMEEVQYDPDFTLAIAYHPSELPKHDEAIKKMCPAVEEAMGKM